MRLDFARRVEISTLPDISPEKGRRLPRFGELNPLRPCLKWSMKSIIQKTVILGLVFLLSNVSGAYAAAECVALSRSLSCSIPAASANMSKCCQRKMAGTCLAETKRSCASSGACPLKYVIGKSLDEFVTNSRPHFTQHIVLFHLQPAVPVMYGIEAVAFLAPIAASPPLFITQQNLRI